VGPIDTSAAEQITRGDQIIEFMRVSADNKWLLYDSTLYGNADIFRMPLEGGPAERLTTDPADEFAPDLSSDGRWLVYHSFRTKSRDIFVKPMDGGPIEQVTGTPAHESYPVWLPDGSLLFFDQLFKDGVPGGYFTVRSGGSRNWGSPVALDVSRRVYSLRWLRDNRVAYVRDLQNDIPSGRFQIEVKSLTSGETRILYRGTSEDDPRPEVIDVDEEEHRIYFKSHDASGRAEFWTLPLSGGRPRLLVKFSDPARQSRRYEFDAAAGRFYFAVDERRSNIWIADIAAK
jgi:hypothetical protein